MIIKVEDKVINTMLLGYLAALGEGRGREGVAGGEKGCLLDEVHLLSHS